MAHNRLIPAVLSVIVVLAATYITGLWYFSGEDTWTCKDGRWTAHGKPSSPKPATGCPAPAAPQIMQAEETYSIYFSNERLSPTGNTDCGLVYGTTRVRTEGRPYGISTVLEDLFAGPTATESKAGYASMFSEKTRDMLKHVVVVGGTAYLDFTDIRSIIPNASTSCGSAEFFASVTETLRHNNPNIKRTLYAINGKPADFYEWMQIGCTKDNDNCDPEPFNAR